jgi:DNA polymerase III sliding clamp (beta) subunit (PCNA family)
MTCVYINEVIAATDGHRLAWFQYSAGLTVSSMLVESFAAKIISRLTVTTVYHDGNGADGIAEFRNNNGQIVITRLMDEKYPGIKNVIPAAYTTKAVVDRDDLIDAIYMALETANKVTHQVSFHFLHTGEVKISSFDYDYDSSFETELPCRVKGEEIRIGFNGRLLLSVLEKVDDNPVTIKLTAPNRAAVVHDCFLLMPVMLNQYDHA